MSAHPPHPPSRRALWMALGAIALWSTLAALGVRLRHVPPFLLVGVSLLVGALVGVRGLSWRGLRPGVLLLGVWGLFAYHFCLFMALRLAPPIEANLLNYLWPSLIVLLSPLLLPGSRLHARHVLGVGLGFAGAALLTTGGRLSLASEHAWGYLLAIGAAVIWSSYSLLTRRIGDFPTSTVSAFCLVSGALSLACHFLLEPSWRPAAEEVPLLLFVGLGPMGGAFYLWDRAMKDGDPRRIGSLAYLAPPLSTLFVSLAGGGALGPLPVLATAMVVAGAAIGSAGREGPAAER